MKNHFKYKNYLKTLIYNSVLIYILFSCANRKVERVETYGSGDTLFYKDSVTKEGKPIVFDILSDSNTQLNKQKTDTLFRANQILNENAFARYLKTEMGLHKNEIFKPDFISDLYRVSIETDTIKCGNPLIVKIWLSYPDNSSFIIKNKEYITDKTKKEFKLKINSSCSRLGINSFVGLLKVRNGEKNELEKEIEIKYNYLVIR